MRKCGNISLYMRRPLVIYDFATAPLWISLYMRKIWPFVQRSRGLMNWGGGGVWIQHLPFHHSIKTCYSFPVMHVREYYPQSTYFYQRWNRVIVSAHSARAYTATLLMMVNVVHPPPSPARANFTLMMECTPESDCCNSAYSVVLSSPLCFCPLWLKIRREKFFTNSSVSTRRISLYHATEFLILNTILLYT